MKLSEDELHILAGSQLFSGIAEPELAAILDCLAARRAVYGRDAFILRSGDTADEVGIVVSGKVHVLTEDHWGNRNIVTAVGPGQMFGESFAGAPGAVLSVDAVAAEETVVLFMAIRRITMSCSNACSFHARLSRNLLGVLAQRNLVLTDKVRYLSKRSVRDKALAYLSAQARRQGSATFDIPFDRQELADYLACDRSALSNTLCKLRDEGLIVFERNRFTLL